MAKFILLAICVIAPMSPEPLYERSAWKFEGVSRLSCMVRSALQWRRQASRAEISPTLPKPSLARAAQWGAAYR